MSTEDVKSDLQKALTKDLSKLQARLEHYEDLAAKGGTAEEATFNRSQVAYYREEAKAVRGAVLEMHAAVMAELKK